MNLSECMELGCSEFLKREHRKHLAEMKKVERHHVCTKECYAETDKQHQLMHLIYQAKKIFKIK